MFIFADWIISSLFPRVCSNQKKYVYPSEKWRLDSENGIFVDFAMLEKKSKKKELRESCFLDQNILAIFFEKHPKNIWKICPFWAP